MLPRSPWDELLADKKKAGVPTEEKVAAILLAINPLFPTPQRITLAWHFAISLTASLNELFKVFFNLINPDISRLITSFAVLIKFFFIINVQKLIICILQSPCQPKQVLPP